MKKHALKLIVLISLLGLTSRGGILLAEESSAKSAFDKVVQKMYGNDADAMEKSVKKMHNSRDGRINSAIGEDTLDYEMTDLQKKAQALLQGAKQVVPVEDTAEKMKREMMQKSLSPEMLKMMGIDNPDGKEISPEEAIQMGILQQLELLREKSQYQVENLLTLQLIPDPKDPENYFVRFPWIIPYAATIVRDKGAIPGLFNIWFKEKSKLGIFFVFIIFTFFLSRFMCRLYNRNVNTLVAVARFFVRMFTMQCLRLIFFVYLFYNQLGPIGRVTKEFVFVQLKT